MLPDLSLRACPACDGWEAPLTDADMTRLKGQLDPAWEIDKKAQTLTRKFTFKGYAKAVYTANLVAFLSDKAGHHADVAFGWGYCTVTYTSHELGALTESDLICAAKLDAMMA